MDKYNPINLVISAVCIIGGAISLAYYTYNRGYTRGLIDSLRLAETDIITCAEWIKEHK